MPSKPHVFVIMPFAQSFQDVYTDLVKDPLESAGFDVTRADTLLNQVNILQDVVRGIADADLVVADVTGLNGNVLYELGLAHALGKRTVMITQKLEELPFDLRPYRATEYSTNFKRASELRDFLADLGAKVVAGEADFSNPVQDYAPYALSQGSQVSEAPKAQSNASEEEQVSADDDKEDDSSSLGFLEHIVHMQTANERIADVGGEIGARTGELGEMFQVQTKRMERAQNSLGDRAAGALLTIARDAGRELNSYSDHVAPLMVSLRESINSLAEGANAVARSRTVASDEEASQIEGEINELRTLEETSREAVESIGGFAQTLIDLPSMERNLTAAARRAGGLMAEAAEVLQNGEAEFARARGLLEERLREYKRTQTALG